MREYNPGRYIISHKRTGMPIGLVEIGTTGRCFEVFLIGTTADYIGQQISKLRAFERLDSMALHYTLMHQELGTNETEGQSDTSGEHLDGISVLGIRPVSAADGVGAVASSAAGG